jgi:hypothetical protein
MSAATPSSRCDGARICREAAAFDCVKHSTEASGKFAEFLTAIRLGRLGHQPRLARPGQRDVDAAPTRVGFEIVELTKGFGSTHALAQCD